MPNDQFTTLNRGISESFSLGGIHLTDYTYAHYFILILLSATERGKWTKETVHQLFSGSINPFIEAHSFENIKHYNQPSATNKNLTIISNITEGILKINVRLWFYIYNKDKYPAWEGTHDFNDHELKSFLIKPKHYFNFKSF